MEPQTGKFIGVVLNYDYFEDEMPLPYKNPRTKKQKQADVKKTMKDWKEGSLHSGSKTGPVVKNQKQAVAIALSESGQSKKKK